MQSGVARMFIPTDELDWQSELRHADRAFAAMLGGQLYENITREEVKRIRHPVYQPATVERKARRYSGAPCSLNQ